MSEFFKDNQDSTDADQADFNKSLGLVFSTPPCSLPNKEAPSSTRPKSGNDGSACAGNIISPSREYFLAIIECVHGQAGWAVKARKFPASQEVAALLIDGTVTPSTSAFSEDLTLSIQHVRHLVMDSNTFHWLTSKLSDVKYEVPFFRARWQDAEADPEDISFPLAVAAAVSPAQLSLDAGVVHAEVFKDHLLRSIPHAAAAKSLWVNLVKKMQEHIASFDLAHKNRRLILPIVNAETIAREGLLNSFTAWHDGALLCAIAVHRMTSHHKELLNDDYAKRPRLKDQPLDFWLRKYQPHHAGEMAGKMGLTDKGDLLTFIQNYDPNKGKNGHPVHKFFQAVATLQEPPSQWRAKKWEQARNLLPEKFNFENLVNGATGALNAAFDHITFMSGIRNAIPASSEQRRAVALLSSDVALTERLDIVNKLIYNGQLGGFEYKNGLADAEYSFPAAFIAAGNDTLPEAEKLGRIPFYTAMSDLDRICELNIHGAVIVDDLASRIDQLYCLAFKILGSTINQEATLDRSLEERDRVLIKSVVEKCVDDATQSSRVFATTFANLLAIAFPVPPIHPPTKA